MFISMVIKKLKSIYLTETDDVDGFATSCED